MSEIAFESMESFFSYIHSKGGANPPQHGTVGNFYAMMKQYTDPNTCSCKKGKNAYNTIFNMCRAISITLAGEQLANVRTLFDNQTVVVNEGGKQITKY